MKGNNVFSISKALDPGFSVMAAKEILPQISYRTPAAVRQGKMPAYPENNLSRISIVPAWGRSPDTKYPVPFPFPSEAREQAFDSCGDDITQPAGCSWALGVHLGGT